MMESWALGFVRLMPWEGRRRVWDRAQRFLETGGGWIAWRYAVPTERQMLRKYVVFCTYHGPLSFAGE